jgi:DNA-binding CsgD family transcriptional regulator/PAS domain-containing protein
VQRAQTVDDIVATFYQSALGTRPWGDALEALRKRFQARLVNLYGLARSSMSVALSFEVGDVPAHSALEFICKYHRIEPRAQFAMDQPVGTMVSCHRHFSDDFVAGNAFYQEFFIPNGLRYTSGMKVFEDQDHVVFCAVHRGVGTSPLNDAEESLLAQLCSHLQQAMALYMREQHKLKPELVGLSVLQRMPQAMVLMDETRHVVFHNQAAAELLKGGGTLHISGGKLSAGSEREDARLLLALRSLMFSSGSYVGAPRHDDQVQAPERGSESPDRTWVILQGRGGATHCLWLHSLRAESSMGAFGPRNLALGLLLDLAKAPHLPPDPYVVAATWDLSPAETKVAMRLREGDTPQDIANALGLSLATIRSQMQAVLRKTSTSRQAELVSVMHGLPPSLV